jgi:hypothetical protein
LHHPRKSWEFTPQGAKKPEFSLDFLYSPSDIQKAVEGQGASRRHGLPGFEGLVIR